MDWEVFYTFRGLFLLLLFIIARLPLAARVQGILYQHSEGAPDFQGKAQLM